MEAFLVAGFLAVCPSDHDEVMLPVPFNRNDNLLINHSFILLLLVAFFTNYFIDTFRTADMPAPLFVRKRICPHQRTAPHAGPHVSSKYPATAAKCGCAMSRPQTVIYSTIIFVAEARTMNAPITNQSCFGTATPDDQLDSSVPIDTRKPLWHPPRTTDWLMAVFGQMTCTVHRMKHLFRLSYSTSKYSECNMW